MACFIERSDELYPALLKKIPKPPLILYYKGSYTMSLFERCIAVVGSRNVSIYGKKVIKKIVNELVSVGITIVSGFMYGVDACAHLAALGSGGKTIAVLPCGIDLTYPKDHKDLYEQILTSKSLILSEFKDNIQPQKWMYIKRNQIVAGISHGTLVIEAGLNSGSLITARFAKEFNKKLFVVPGDMFSDTYTGICQLISEGATVVTSGFEIAEILGFTFDKVTSLQINSTSKYSDKDFCINSIQKKVAGLLKASALSFDELSKELGISIGELSSNLTLMEMKGLIVEEKGKYHVY